MRDCPTCGQATPEGHFCIRCGAPLDSDLSRSRHRAQFAAAPGQHRYAPWLVSTLFPHLPRHSERHFHLALAGGAAVVIALGALRLFGVALITAALLLPLLTVLYFYDADIYEHEPAWAAGWTVGWGLLTGLGVGLLAKALGPSGAALIDRTSGAHLVTGGILIPALGVIVVLAGPLMLLRRSQFNDVLDGAVFAAFAAAAFAAAEAVVVGVGVLSGGVRPAGAAVPWIERLIAIAIATPVLWMSAMGAACAAVWLRYRSPVADRGALGVTGHPVVAILIAAALVIAGTASEAVMAAGAWLAWLVALDLVALALLRRAVHVGLLEEAAEREIGPEIRCVNCGTPTATHTFCGGCGIALKALPKARDPARRGAVAGRLTVHRAGRPAGHWRLVAWGGALAVTVGAGFAVAAIAAPTTPKPACQRGLPCAGPPIRPQVLFTFPGETAWRSSSLGFWLRYPGNWSIGRQGGDHVALQSDNGVLLVAGAPASQTSAAQLIQAQVSALQGQLLGLTRDSAARDQLLGTNLGLVPGPGEVYTGTISTPQGPQAPVAVGIVAATKNGLSIVAAAIAPGDDPSAKAAVYQDADDMIDSIRWPGT